MMNAIGSRTENGGNCDNAIKTDCDAFTASAAAVADCDGDYDDDDGDDYDDDRDYDNDDDDCLHSHNDPNNLKCSDSKVYESYVCIHLPLH